MNHDFDTDAEKLLTDEKDNIPRPQAAVYRFTRWHVIFLTSSIGSLFLLQILILAFSVGRHTSSPHIEDYKVWKDCGNNATEARQRGCVFDVMMTGWVKEDCYNKALSDQILLEGGFRFFRDAEGTDEIPLDVIRLGEHTHMYTNDLHHRAHCVYVWKLQALALESQAQGKIKLIDSESYTLVSDFT